MAHEKVTAPATEVMHLEHSYWVEMFVSLTAFRREAVQPSPSEEEEE